MKRIFTFLIAGGFCATSFAQLPVSTTPENRNVVLEEFTGIYCGYCPDGHERANSLRSSKPAGDVILINVHTGGYANPGPGDPDFRTNFGSALASQSGLTGYPSGTVNREVLTGSTTAMNRGAWSSAANTVLGENSYVNVAMEAEVNVQTREMVVDVEVYYTGNAGVNNNLNVVLLQNNIEGPQSNYGPYNTGNILPNGNYLHHHMLRHMLTGQWGDQITTTTMGTTVTRQYKYTLPEDIRGVDVQLGELEVAAFITEGQQYIVSGTEYEPDYVNFTTTNDANVAGIEMGDFTFSCDENVEPTIIVTNGGQAAITSLTIEYDINGQNTTTTNWTGNIDNFRSEEITLDPIKAAGRSNTSGSANAINVRVTGVNGAANEAANDGQMASDYNNIGFGDLEIEINHDRWASEISWKLTNTWGNVVAEVKKGDYADAGTVKGTQTHPVSFSGEGCYHFEIWDSESDGMKDKVVGSVIVRDDDGRELMRIEGNEYTNYGEGKFEMQFVTSVQELEAAESLKVYPNPFNDVLNVELDLDGTSQVTVALYDMLGSVVYTESANYSSGINLLSIESAGLQNGVYFLNVNINGELRTEKVVLNR